MTVIAYRDGILAADSLPETDGLIVPGPPKLARRGKAWVACERALRESDPDVFLLAGRYSLLDQPALDRLFPACAERGARVVVGGPYNSGLLAGGRTFEYREAPGEMVAKRDRIAEVCRRHGTDIRAAALQFCAAHPVVAAIIPGAKHAEKVHENAHLMAEPTPPALWEELKRENLLPAEAPTPQP